MFRRILRSLSLVSEPADPPALQASWTGDIGVQPAYDLAAASAAPASFAWLYAALIVKVGAASGLPIKVYRSSKGKRTDLPDHWLPRLMERPNRSTDGVVFRRELLADLTDHGNAYVLLAGMGRRKAGGLQLYRLHPDWTTLVEDEYGIKGYQYDVAGKVTVYSPDVVLHVRQPAFGSGPTRINYGVGAVQPLKKELEAEWSAIDRANTQFKRGRPDVFLMPAEGSPDWTAPVRDEVAATYNRLARNGGGMALSKRIEVKETTFSPQDLEGSSLRDRVRSGVMAVTGTPPVMMGLETANFATAREQTSNFWVRLLSDLMLLDSGVYTQLLRRAGEDDTYAEHDTSGVPSLQAWRNDAWSRVMMATGSGVPILIALETEGLQDVAERMREDGITGEPQVEELTLASWWTRSAGDASAPGQDDIIPPQDEAGRDALWRAWIERAHAPSERGVNARVLAYLIAAKARVATKIQDVWPIPDSAAEQRSITDEPSGDEIVDAIFDDVAESKAFAAMLTPTMKAMLQAACLDALRQLAASGVELTPKRINELVDEQLGSLIVTRALPGDRIALVTQATREACAEMVRKGLQDGATISEMTARIQQEQGFSPARALRIARTETTRAVNQGTLSAYDVAESDLGVSIQREWLSARDEATRDSHWALDGQRVGKGESFVVPAEGNGHSGGMDAGLTGTGPGGFGKPGMDINCRCSLAPVVIRKAKEQAS